MGFSTKALDFQYDLILAAVPVLGTIVEIAATVAGARSAGRRFEPCRSVIAPDSIERWSSLVELGCCFEGGADPEHGRLIERTADDLHRQGQAARREAGWNRHRRVAGDVKRYRLNPQVGESIWIDVAERFRRRQGRGR